MPDPQTSEEFMAAFDRIKEAVQAGREPDEVDEAVVCDLIRNLAFRAACGERGQQPADAEDTAQEVTIKLMLAIRACKVDF